LSTSCRRGGGASGRDLDAGLPPFLGFGPLAWASLAGHMFFGVVTAFVVELRMRQAARTPTAA
jgi:hypothetical protein